MQIIVSEAEIERAVSRLGEEINGFYAGKPLTVVVLLMGAVYFAADLTRKLRLPLRLDTLAVSSYQRDTRVMEVRFRSALKEPVNGRHVLLVDEVLDSGKTLLAVSRHMSEQGALSVRTAVMVEKTIPRPEGVVHADWAGVFLSEDYLVGYGLDSCEKYRNLPCIARLEQGDDASPERVWK